jgi:protein TonB
LALALAIAAAGHLTLWLISGAARQKGTGHAGNRWDPIAVTDGTGFTSPGVVASRRGPGPSRAARAADVPVAVPAPQGETAPATPVSAPAGPGAAPFGAGAGTASGRGEGEGEGEGEGAREQYLALVREAIARERVYPPAARSRAETGSVRVAFSVEPSGEITEVRIASPSVYGTLNRAALEAVKRAGRVPPPPLSLGRGPLRVELEVDYRLD